MPVAELTPREVLLHDAHGLLGPSPGWHACCDPVSVIQADRPDDVAGALARVEAAARAGYTAAGFVSYEASPAFDSALRVRPSGPLPLLWFGLYAATRPAAPPEAPAPNAWEITNRRPSVTDASYHRAVERIRDYIAAGDTYQVNYTWRLRAHFAGDPHACFASLYRNQKARYAAYLDLGDHALCSASPELFFLRIGRELTCMPMKGTARRGLSSRYDREQAAWLRASEKNRAENVMIVDMVRNDLGRLARPGEVSVASLFDLERYDTLWQMTSTVRARSDASLPTLFNALFPCASITGAPKVRTCEIIAEMESTPRGIYTGCIGFVAPGGDAQFNVAIRTAHIHRPSGRFEYGTGGGITWESQAADELKESLTKSLVLTARRPAFQLLETLLWKPGGGYFLLDLHLRRLRDSADYFDIPLRLDEAEAALLHLARQFHAQRQRVRLLVEQDGTPAAEAHPLGASGIRRWRVRLAEAPVDPSDVFLYHKTTHRETYERARAGAPDCDDALLWNARGELTESTIANMVVKLAGRLYTPPVSCGLLPGVYREHLLAAGRVEERIIPVEELPRAEALYLVNSVRGWIPAVLDH